MELIKIVKRKTQSVSLFIHWLFGLAIVIALIVVFAKLAEDVWFQEGFSWDAPIILAIHQLGNPTLDATMRFVTQMGEAGAITIAVILAGWFTRKRNYIDALTIIVSLGGAVAINSLLKLLFARPRPGFFPPLVTESGFSFPSGHVTVSVAVYGFLAVYLWKNKKQILGVLSAMWIIAVAVSRIYLGVHYPSDTLAAIAFSSLWLIGVYLVHNGYIRQMKQTSP